MATHVRWEDLHFPQAEFTSFLAEVRLSELLRAMCKGAVVTVALVLLRTAAVLATTIGGVLLAETGLEYLRVEEHFFFGMCVLAIVLLLAVVLNLLQPVWARNNIHFGAQFWGVVIALVLSAWEI